MRIVALTGSGISAESGIPTFRDAGGLWENYPVEDVASHDGWIRDPCTVNRFYNMMRHKYVQAQPCGAHLALSALQEHHDVRIVTQNVDDLHERAGSRHVLHLHGELFKTCSSADVDDVRFHRTLVAPDLDVADGARTADGALERPFIVFFGEAVPLLTEAAREVEEAEILLVIGTSLQVYPAASLVHYAKKAQRIVLIDPAPSAFARSAARVEHLQCGASEGMRRFCGTLEPLNVKP